MNSNFNEQDMEQVEKRCGENIRYMLNNKPLSDALAEIVGGNSLIRMAQASCLEAGKVIAFAWMALQELLIEDCLV